MIRALTLILALLCGSAHAQFDCAFKTPDAPNEAGTIQVHSDSAITPLGRWAYHWCPDPARPGFWRFQSFAVLKKYQNTISDPIAVLLGILQAPNRIDAINAAMLSARIVPPPGSQDEYEWQRLLFAACLAAGSPPADMQPRLVRLGSLCNEPKRAPPPPASAYVTPAAGAIFTYSNGKLTGLTGRRSTAGAACDCAKAKATVGAKTYCALANGPATEATECVKVTP